MLKKRGSKSKGGRLPTALKLKAIKRVERGEGVVPVARDLGVTRKALHDWIRAYKAVWCRRVESQTRAQAWAQDVETDRRTRHIEFIKPAHC